MSIFLNWCLGLFAIAGLGTAIGAPILLNSNKTRKADDVSGRDDTGYAGGGVEQTSTSLKSISKCNSSGNLSTINYGDSSAEEVCGELQSSTEGSPSLTDEEKYNDLFQKTGGKSKSSGSSGNGIGQSVQCQSRWYFSQSLGNTIEHLGLCDNTSSNSQKGVLVENKNTENPQISVCEGECFGVSSTLSSYSTKSLNFNDKKGQWYKLQFKKKK